jgi:death-on-curing protein
VTSDPEGVEFLTVEVVLALHERQLRRFGGAPGLRDRGLLESAVAQPSASFDGVYVHDGLFGMAAAYLFHLVSNHPFVDGNKRTGLLAAQVFLRLNGVEVLTPSDRWYELTMGVAEGRIRKAEVSAELLRLTRSTTGP